MAAPIQLKANTPGGNNFRKSASAQRPYKSKPTPMVTKPQVRTDAGKKTGGVKPAYAASKAVTRPKIKGVNSRKTDYASAWMQSHGLKNAQNFGSVPRLPFATVPADMIGAGSQTLKSRSQVSFQPVPKKRSTSKSSSGPTNSRVKMTVTGRNYQNTRKGRVMTAKKPAV